VRATVARLGGDEFAIVLEIASADEPAVAAQRVLTVRDALLRRRTGSVASTTSASPSSPTTEPGRRAAQGR
jgi:GGDEF domain-containing protein